MQPVLRSGLAPPQPRQRFGARVPRGDDPLDESAQTRQAVPQRRTVLLPAMVEARVPQHDVGGQQRIPQEPVGAREEVHVLERVLVGGREAANHHFPLVRLAAQRESHAPSKVIVKATARAVDRHSSCD